MTKKDDLPAGVSPDIARALLDANPDLRGKGLNTNLVVGESKKVATDASKAEALKSGPLLVELKVIKQQLQNSEAKLEQELKRLAQERKRVRDEVLARVQRLFNGADAEAANKAMAAEKTFLDSLGFKK